MRAIVVGGTCSGVGKTTVAVGLMAAYRRRGLRVQPFKIGPDSINPLHHRAATGRDSLNLDTWMLSREVNLACFMRCAANTDVAIVEGLMGLYDGRDGKSELGSTAEMAKLLAVPVLLVLDSYVPGRSAAAVIRGYTTFDEEVKFAGVIINKVEDLGGIISLADTILAAKINVRLLGAIPQNSKAILPVISNETDFSDAEGSLSVDIKEVGDLVEEHLDLDALLEHASFIEPRNNSNFGWEQLTSKWYFSPAHLFKLVRIGVARDVAFCLYYHENLNLLQDAGAELVFFSPLKDSLPPRLDSLYFGGGYLDQHLEKLSSNKQMLYAVRAFADAGGIIYGESAGLMYLSQGVEGKNKETFSMCGVFPFWVRIKDVQVAYAKVYPQDFCALLPTEIGEIRGQLYRSGEIFSLDSNTINTCPTGVKLEGCNIEELEGYMQGRVIGSFVHLHFGSNLTVAHAFIEQCRMDGAKVAAVAAASASAVFEAGPKAAAAAGAAAAAAVTAALGGSKELVPYCGDVVGFTGSGTDSSTLFSPRIERVSSGIMKGSPKMMRQFPRATSSCTLCKDLLHEQRSSVSKQTSLFPSNTLNDDPIESASCKNASTRALVRSKSASWDGKLVLSNRFFEINGVISRSDRSTNSLHKELIPRKDYSTNSREDASTSSNGYLFSPNTICGGSSTDGEVCEDNIPGLQLQRQYYRPFILQAAPSSSGSIGYSRKSMTAQSSVKLGNENNIPERIVSLLPSATEILVELGVGNRLLGITELCTRPDGVRNGRHVVMKFTKDWVPKLDLPWLSKIKPDFVIAQDSFESGSIDCGAVTKELLRAGIVHGKNTTFFMVATYTVADIWSFIVDVGNIVGHYTEACLLVNALRSRLRRVVAAVSNQQRKHVLLLQGLHPFLLGGRWIPEMEVLAGGHDSLQRPGCSAQKLQWQQVLEYAPKVLIFSLFQSSIAHILSEVVKLAKQPGFWSIPAVELREVYICESSFFDYPGPRLVDGTEILAHILHPAAVSSSPFHEVAMKLSLKEGKKCRAEDLSKYFTYYH
ncbi:hypothetical protein O6H91_01G004900 [Diphasiastrum complanatum]|uniref:Uncharacterized protein n=1 Tax=Diphasiastrum complanatum TaxID=34168 RepID=A0ACC2EMS3_DIPCM|nr:hypothetical protein O6H91_01G004900 [Diphasiastrum complanatum]